MLKRKKRKPQHQALLRLIKAVYQLQKQVQLLRLDVQRNRMNHE